ncbi:unnamed protein product [Oikopleura dioica]|uniref:Uncharacterized protein n=1 Tax=Oikopleura dioica TaxID=34765 RepID=E4YVF6_OIKDI|nr:unnamed protein product [Oikopleura dioica]
MKLVRNVGCRLRRAVRFLVNTTWLVLVFRLLGSGAPSAHSRKRNESTWDRVLWRLAPASPNFEPFFHEPFSRVLFTVLVQTRLARKLREKGRRSRDDLKK